MTIKVGINGHAVRVPLANAMGRLQGIDCPATDNSWNEIETYKLPNHKKETNMLLND